MDLRRKGTRAHRRLLVLAAAVGIALPAGALAARPVAPAPVTIQILNVSDWHGNVDPVGTSGGAWNISARWAVDRQAYPTLTLAAGDDFGATPPLSSFFEEEPAVQAQRLMGVQVGTLGNHDFDRGIAHLQQMIDLAAAPSSGSSGDHPGQPYRYVAANLSNVKENLSGVDPVAYLSIAGLTVAVIGIVNEEAPTLVGVGNFGTMTVTDGVAAANHYAKLARNRGADAVVVLTHKGFEALVPAPAGPIVDFAEGLTPGLVDVVVGDHTNVKHSMTVNGILIHENLSFGNTYSKTLLTVQPGMPGSTTGRRGRVTAKSVTFVDPVAGGLSNNKTSCGALQWCDQRIVDMLVPYRTSLAAEFDTVIGTATMPFDRGGNIERRQEMPIGDLIADGMREIYGTQLAFFNGGGIRAQLPACGYYPVDTSLRRSNWALNHTDLTTCTGGYASGTPVDIVAGDVYTVLPFGNNVLTRTVTGRQLWEALENGVSQFNSVGVNGSGRFPQISGFRFTFDTRNASGCTGAETAATWRCTPSRITHVELSDGTEIPYSDASTYTMATIDFLNAGGDSYFVFADGQGVTRDRDANVFFAYLNRLGGVLDPSTYPLDRITKISATP